MAEDNDNLVLRLLREIRADTGDLRARLVRVERRVDELHDSAAMALGFAAPSTRVVEDSGARFDELRAEIDALKHRVEELEQAK